MCSQSQVLGRDGVGREGNCGSLTPAGNEGPPDASFQCDPEHYSFLCLSIEETWNFLDSQARDASRAIKVRGGREVVYTL